MAGLPTEELEVRQSLLQEQLAHVGDLRLGSLIYRYRRCGKPTCVCGSPGHKGHGGWIISRSTGRRTVMSTVPNEEDLPKVRQQLEEGRRFWKLAQEFAEVSDELSRRKLSEAAAKATAKKGALRKSSRSRSPRKIERLIGTGAAEGLDFEAIETAARREAMRIAARAVERRLNGDSSDYRGPFLPCSCGGRMRYEGRRPKTFTTVLGDMTFMRAYYQCETCRESLVPRDRALSIERISLVPRSRAHDRTGCRNGEL